MRAALVSKAAALQQASTRAAKGAATGLRVGEADDVFEREADRLADEVMRGASPRPVWSLPRVNQAPPVQRKCKCGGTCAECRAGTLREAPDSVQEALRTPGEPLSRELRSFFEPRFGFDFSRVRVHAGPKAAESAEAVAARAYAVGNDLVFGAGSYAPHSAEGRRLVAHELAHVVQQSEQIHTQRVQRDSSKGNPAHHDQCPIKSSQVEDGDGDALDPPLPVRGTAVEYVIYAKPVPGDTRDSIQHRMSQAFVDKHYGDLSAEKKSAALRALESIPLKPIGDLRQECAFIMWLAGPVMDHMYQVTGIELRVEKAAREKKAKEAEEARKQAGKSAEQREAKAGLPPPPDADQKKKETPPADPTKSLSGSEYTGPHEKTGNTAALPAELKGPELQPTHGTGTYTMQLQYAWVSSDLLSQVVEAMNWVNYHWERYDITDLVMKGLSDKDKEKLKQQAPNKEAEVGKMAAAGRRADYAYEDLKQETETSYDDLMHPTQSATTGSAREIAGKAIANYENLTLLPASAIISAGGWALGALADLMGGTEQEREIPWPNKPGYYFVRCIAQPDPQGKNGEQRRVASVAVKTVEVRDVTKLAKTAAVEDDARLSEKKLEIEIAKHKTPIDQKEIDRLNQELADLQTKAGGSAPDVIRLAIQEKTKAKEGASKYRQAKLDEEISALEDQLALAESRDSGPIKPTRLQAHLVSNITGSVYPLLLELGTMEPTTKKIKYGISDVTSRDGAFYRGEADTDRDAAWNAVRDFAFHNDYGKGILAIAMPPGSPFQFPAEQIDNANHDTAIAKRRIDDLVKVLVILGLFVPGVGEVAMVLGAAAAAAHLIERWQNGTLRADESAVSDLIGVLGAVLTGVSAIGELRVVRTSESFLLKTVGSIGEAAEAGNKALNYGGMIWGNLQRLDEIMADNEAELRGDISHAQARRNRADKLAAALQDGAIVLGSLKGHGAGGEEHATVEQKTDDTAEHEQTKTGDTPANDTAAKAQEGTGEKKPDDAAAKQKPAVEPTDPADAVILAGKSGESVDMKSEKTEARVPTADGLHQIFVLEDGRIIRCSLTCGELRNHYQGFIDSALKDPDPARQKAAKELQKRLETAELGAKSADPKERQSAAQDAANLEPQLRQLAVKDLAAQTGATPARLEKLSQNFTPDEIRDLRNTLGAKRFADLADGVKVQQQLSIALAAAGSDPNVHETAMKIVADGLGKVPANQLAEALSDLAKLQSHVPGYITGDFLSEYEAAVAKGDAAGAKKLLKAAETGFREAQKANQKAEMLKELAPLEAQHAAQKTTLDELRGKERDLQDRIRAAKSAMDEAVKKQDRAKTPEGKEQARQEALAARDRMNAAKEELDKLPSSSQAETDLARTQQAMSDVRLRMDPESRAPLPCFSGDTPVWTSLGLRRIDEIRAGDPIFAFDFGSGGVVQRRVRRVFQSSADHFFHIHTGGSVVRATGRHRFWIEGLNQWVPAAELEPGMRLHARENEEAAVEEVVLEEHPQPVDTWNLSVDGNPNYFVGPGVLVHNQGGFDTKLGGDITIYRGTNKKFPKKVYVGKTTDVTAGGKSRGIDAREGEHQAYARQQLENRSALSKEDIAFYEFMSEVQLTELVTGLATPEQGQYLEQKNIEIEGTQPGVEVLNRRNEITSPDRMKRIAETIKNDPKVKAAGFCTR